MTDGEIALSSEDLTAASSALSDGASTFRASQGPLRTSIPATAFGLLGAPIAAAGNTLGAGFGLALEKLATLATDAATAVDATNKEFSRIEEDAAARFASLDGGGA